MAGEPVEYAVAVDRYLAAADLRRQSIRVYRIALATWAWALIGRIPPAGHHRRRAAPPILPLALLDAPDAPGKLRATLAVRTATTESRTLSRELSILRRAVRWWRACGWIHADPTRDLSIPVTVQPRGAELTPADVAAVLRLPASLRDQTLWHLLYESAAPIESILALDVDDLDLSNRRTRPTAAIRSGDERCPIRWRAGSARLLPLLLVSRTGGPVFLTDRRAPAGGPRRDRCPFTGRSRLSYRRAAELFTDATRPLDSTGRGWTLRQLRAAGKAHVKDES
jgi:integrase